MVDCTGLENRQRETVREFESHRLRQNARSGSQARAIIRSVLKVICLRRTGFIALLAMCVLVVAPTITRFIAFDRAAPQVVEVCTAEGTVWKSLPTTELGQSELGNQSPILAHGGGDCPYCNLQTDKLIASAARSTTAIESVALLPSLFYQAPKPLFAWVTRPARAPPSAS